MRFTSFAALIVLVSVAVAEFTCENPKVVATTTAGEDGLVTVKALECSNQQELVQAHDAIRFNRRQIIPNECGATCTTNCFPGQVGTGPSPNDCTVIADALLFDSQNIGDIFVADPANNTAVLFLTYMTCASLFLNQAGVALEYYRSDFSALTTDLAFNCQAQQNAHGGNCIANDGLWFAQVMHS